MLSLAWTGARRRIPALGALAVVIALGVGVSLAAVEAAARTERVYPTYLRKANVGELVINPSFATERAEEIIAATPGVTGYTSDDFMIATVDDGAPRRQSVVDSTSLQLRMSANGRYVTQDRPVVHEGRMIRSGMEAFLSREAAAALDVDVGDDIPLVFWVPSYLSYSKAPDDIVEPIGRAEARVVGIGVFADEVLVDELYPRQRVLVTSEVAQPFTCTFSTPQQDDRRDIAEIMDESLSDTCALAYRYYSLQIDGGDRGVGAVTEALQAAFIAENDRLPNAIRADDQGYFVIPSATRDERAQLDRSLQPAVAALRLFGLAIGTATLIVALLGSARIARRDRGDVLIWRHLGVVRDQRLLAVAAPLLLTIAVGLGGAAAVGWLASGTGPVASARAVEPDAGRQLSAQPAQVVLGAAALGLALGALAVAATTARATTPRQAVQRRFSARLASLSSRPSRALGVRAALANGGAGAVLLGSIAAVGVVLATLVFSTSLQGLVDVPDRYGWPYDAGVMVGYGYGGADTEAIGATLDRSDVRDWGVASFVPVFMGGDTVPAVASGRGLDAMPFPVVMGELPVAADEIALGAQTADQLGLGVGDEVEVSNDFGNRLGRVTGVVVLPALGPFESDRTGTGTGVLLAGLFFDALVAEGEVASDAPVGSIRTQLDTFIAIDLRDGVEPAAFLESIDDALVSWDVNGYLPFKYPTPVRPPQIADVEAMRRVPVALGALFAVAMAIGLALGIASATRARRHELAVLRALGCSSRQLGASVYWHALTVVSVALVVGAPIGIAAGRSLYESFAGDLGVVITPVVSMAWTIGVIVAAVVVGVLAAAGPAQRAARARSAAVLHDE